jgi:signal transduction histidine kinase
MNASRLRGTLFLRLALAWCGALLVVHLINVAVGYLRVTDYQITRTRYYLAKDLGVLVPMLEAAGPEARAGWLKKMVRTAYYFDIAPSGSTQPRTGAAFDTRMAADVAAELGPRYPVTLAAGAPDEQVLVQLPLSDGMRLTAHVRKLRLIPPAWGGLIFLLQSLAVVGFTWLAVRQATRPLQRLVEAAESLGASMQCEPIAEDGPVEVARAAAAFNAMGRRIKEHLAERVRILAAISHDLQTPITRMRLRAELTDNAVLRAKLESDLDAMQVLVEEGIAYARSAEPATESACAVDIGALLDSLVCDYADAGHDVRLQGALALVVVTRPHTLRRIVVNLADNALKFGDDVEIVVDQSQPQRVSICVRDRGPGIDEAQLGAVFQPFYRVETSRNRSTGGTGLGLAIAQQLSLALGATLTLANRVGGGLEAVLMLPAQEA